MSRLKDSFSSYIKHRWSVQSKYSLHSPFIYTFWAGLLKDHTICAAYSRVERLRKEWLRDESVIHRKDFGAGSEGKAPLSGEVKVKELARGSLVSAAKGQFLYKLARVNKPVSILEFGTSLGLSSLYMSEAAPDARIVTIEGCDETAAIAASNFEKAGKKNITVLSGTFDDKIGEALKMLPVPDLLFFDGNHRLEATLRYWEKCLPSLHAGSVAVFDDIHWSPEMEEAWRLIIALPEVKVSIDLYHLGVIYFREELSKEDFVLRF